ncbi:MAG: adenylyltransferase/cytidyltransferase family protein [Promethearchaeota archaeon]
MTVGIIFGTWDLFHIGHLTALINASYQCDILWIVVYSDKAVKKYKGHFPAIVAEDRVKLIQYLHLNCSIIVTSLEREPMDLSLFDILFLNETWKERNFPVLNDSFKGRIIYLPMTQGINTTSIMQKCSRIIRNASLAADK